MINFNLQTSTGIYMGTRDVYIAQLKGTLAGLQLVKFGKTEIQAPAQPAQRVEAGKKQAEAIVQAVKRAVQENNISAKKVVVALAGKDVLIRYFQIPKIPKHEWDTAIKFEAKKYIPFKIEELMWDFHVVMPRGKEAKLDVTFVAVKIETAQWYMSLLEQAGLQVVAMEPAPFSLLRLFSLARQLDKNKPAAIVDLDYGMADINIVKDKICYLTRDVSLPLEEEIVFESLLNEIRMSLDYYEKLFPTEIISRILLCGEVELRDWDRTLMEELKIPVNMIDLSRVIKVKKVMPPISMGVAIGLGLRDLTQIIPSVNICKLRAAKPKEAAAKPTDALKLTPEIQRIIMKAFALSSAVLVGLHFWMHSNTAREQQKLEEAISLRPPVSIALDVDALPYDDIESEKVKLAKKVNKLSQIIDKRIFWTEKFNEIPRVLPPGVWLTELSIQDQVLMGKSLTMQGIVYHQDPVEQISVITKLITNIKENSGLSRGFSEIKLGGMNSIMVEGVPAKSFIVNCVRE